MDMAKASGHVCLSEFIIYQFGSYVGGGDVERLSFSAVLKPTLQVHTWNAVELHSGTFLMLSTYFLHRSGLKISVTHVFKCFLKMMLKTNS